VFSGNIDVPKFNSFHTLQFQTNTFKDISFLKLLNVNYFKLQYISKNNHWHITKIATNVYRFITEQHISYCGQRLRSLGSIYFKKNLTLFFPTKMGAYRVLKTFFPSFVFCFYIFHPT